MLLQNLLGAAMQAGKRGRLRGLKDLDSAAITLAEACHFLLDPALPDRELRTAVLGSRAAALVALRSLNGRYTGMLVVGWHQQVKRSYRITARKYPVFENAHWNCPQRIRVHLRKNVDNYEHVTTFPGKVLSLSSQFSSFLLS